MQALARELEVVIIVPIFERQAAGIYRNSAAVIDADGTLLGVYHKMHIPDDPLFNEKYYFTPGDGHLDYHGEKPGEANGFKVWKTRYATIGVLICWDQWYPEAARITALLGAEVIFYPDGDRLASGGEGRVGRRPGRGLAHDPAEPLDRQRRLRRVAQPRRPRGRARHQRHHVLRPLVHRRIPSAATWPRRARAKRSSSRSATRS